MAAAGIVTRLKHRCINFRLGNLYRLGVPEKTIQAILRHANVSTTNTFYIKSAADDTRLAVAKLEKLVIGNAEAANLQSGNEVATPGAATPTALIQ